MKTFVNWLFIPLLLLLPAWYRSLKDAPKLPPGVKVADAANRTKTAAVVAEEEAAAARGATARAMSTRSLMTGAGLAATVAFLLWPEISDAIKSKPHQQATSDQRDDRRRFERQARAAQDVTATEEDEREDRRQQRVSAEEDERISAQKNYQPADHWKWKHESDRNVVCEWIPIDWDWEEYRCHTNFERPVYQQPQPRAPRQQQARNQRRQQPQFVRYGPNVTACKQRGGCPYNGG